MATGLLPVAPMRGLRSRPGSAGAVLAAAFPATFPATSPPSISPSSETSTSSRMRVTETTRSPSAVANRRTPRARRPMMPMPSTGQRMIWPRSVIMTIWSVTRTGKAPTAVTGPWGRLRSMAAMPWPSRPVMR